MPSVVPETGLKEEQLLAHLRAKGLIVELGSEFKKLAAEWRALPEQEKQAIDQELNNPSLNPPLSEIITMSRANKLGEE